MVDTEFTSLVNRRKNLANEIKINDYKGNDVISDLYTKSEHYIYELLQNTEDTKATSVEFRIFPNRLKLIHNGRPFNYKDIEAITNVGNSTKIDPNNIGRFGIGFKSVYTITQTPHITSGEYNFKIKEYLVPEPQDEKIKDMGKTVITLPFENKTKSESELYKTVKEKLVSIKLINLLFLKNIKEITINDIGELTNYKREINQLRSGEINVSKVSLIASGAKYLKEKTEQYLVFDKDTFINSIRYKVEIAYKYENNKIVPVQSSKLFVFFETEQYTNLNFLIQGPYQTSKTRENIPFDESNNIIFKNATTDLICESILILKEMELLDLEFFNHIIPLTDPKTTDKGEMYNSVFDAVKNLLKSEEYALLPIGNKKFDILKNTVITRSNSFFNNLLSTDQLTELYGKKSFIDFEVTEGGEYKELFAYLNEQLKIEILRPEGFSEKISKTFLEKQSDEWIIKFYQRIMELPSLWRSTPQPKGILRNKAIIRMENGEHTEPFDHNGEPKVYLPVGINSKYNNVKLSIYQDESIKKFLKDLGLTEPDLYTEVKEEILPKYKEEEINYDLEDLRNDFIKIIQGYKSFGIERRNNLIEELKEIYFLLVKEDRDEGCFSVNIASSLYLPTNELLIYFEGYEADFIDYEFYHDIENSSILDSFFKDLGLHLIPDTNSYDKTILPEEYKLELRDYIENPRDEQIIDSILEGLENLLENIDAEKSCILWSFLLKHLEMGTKLFQGEYLWKNPRAKNERNKSFESKLSKILKEKRWLTDKNGNFFKPSEININELSDNYERNQFSEKLISLLDFKPELLTDDLPLVLKEKLEQASLIEPYLNQGFTKDKIRMILNKALNETKAKEIYLTDKSFDTYTYETEEDYEESIDFSNNFNAVEATPQESKKERVVNIIDKLENKKQKLENQIATQEKIDSLRAEIETLETEDKKYTFIWFKRVLELEYELSNSENNNSKEIRIYFSAYEYHSNEFIILKYPSRKIPNYIEDLSDLPLKLSLGDKVINTVIDVVNVKDNSIKVKIKKDIIGEISKFKYAEIEVKNVLFLLEELIKEFENLNLNDEDNIKEILPDNLEFVFGPPGTGKTTYLAKFIRESMNKNTNFNILVLTPTNKASDVLARKILEQEESVPDWLIRFGNTGDQSLEESGAVKDKSYNITSRQQNVVISTIARIPYDGFYSGSLKDFKWDLVIFDEASMINLASILYSIYKQRDCCKNFIIAGDPFQIPPITLAQEWKDENIYTLVELNDFEKTNTNHKNYPVMSLRTQYRSIPSIGTLFSNFTYKGLLSHSRKREEKKELVFKGKVLNDINIIEFPIEKFNRLYKAHKLDGSSYHIYSAILTVEFIQELKKEIKSNWNKKNNDSVKADQFNLSELNKTNWTIGVICPYKAQALIIGRIFDEINDDSHISVITDTVHGFQGDECDIVITVLNPPSNINPKVFLNNKNILNVAISRARDYLIILSPNRKTEGFSNLYEPNKMFNIISNDLKDYYNNTDSKNIENIIFKQSDYISENTFITSHQKVNVYSGHNHRYEFRIKEGSIDGDTVDIHLNIQENLTNEQE